MDLSLDVVEFACRKIRIGVIFGHNRTIVFSYICLLFLILFRSNCILWLIVIEKFASKGII